MDRATAKMLEKTRERGGGVIGLTPEENLEIMVQVMSNKELHINACKSYNHTGTTNAVDGTEDDQICGDTKIILG